MQCYFGFLIANQTQLVITSFPASKFRQRPALSEVPALITHSPDAILPCTLWYLAVSNVWYSLERIKGVGNDAYCSHRDFSNISCLRTWKLIVLCWWQCTKYSDVYGLLMGEMVPAFDNYDHTDLVTILLILLVAFRNEQDSCESSGEIVCHKWCCDHTQGAWGLFCGPIHCDHAGFWGDVYPVCKWTRNLHMAIRKCVPTKINRATNDAIQKNFYHWVHQTIQQNKLFFTTFFSHAFSFRNFTCMPSWSFASCLVWEQVVLLVYAVCIASIILAVARFLCITYAEIGANVTLWLFIPVSAPSTPPTCMPLQNWCMLSCHCPHILS